MPVDDRLRAGLEANALSILPQEERPLQAVRRRHRRRLAAAATAAVGGAAAAAIVVVAVALSGTPKSGPPPMPAESSTSAATEARINDSSWARTVTEAQARRLGVGRRLLGEIGPDGEMLVTLQFLRETFALLITDDDGSTEVGDFGTVDYDDAGRLVIVSNSPGCPGCTATVDWALDRDRLDLALVPGSAGRPFQPGERLMLEGAWVREPE